MHNCTVISYQFVMTSTRHLQSRLQTIAAYSTQIKKNDLALKTVQSSEILQEAIEKKKQQLLEKKLQFQEKKQQFQDKVQDTKDRVRGRVEDIIERENIFTVPNFLCIGRIIASPYLGYVIIQGDYSLAMGILVVAGLSDMADGYIARNWQGQMSKFGSFLDPLADKCLMSSLVVTLGYCDLMPLWLASAILFRDIFLIAAAFVIRYKSLPPTHRSLSKYFDATHVTAQLAPTFISKVNTAVQLICVAATLGAPVWNYVDHPALHGLWYLTGATTAAAAISYIVSKDTYKFLQRKK